MHERIFPEAGQTRQKFDEPVSFEGGIFDLVPQTKSRSGGVRRLIQKIVDALSPGKPNTKNVNNLSQIRPGSEGDKEFPLLGPIGRFDDKPDHR